MKRNLIEEPLRHLMQELGNTIYYSLSESGPHSRGHR